MQKIPRSIPALAGFALASASALLAFWVRSYGYAVGGIAPQDPMVIAAFRIGIGLSVVALVCALISLRRPTQGRWLGLGWAVLGLVYWAATALTTH